jgi:predicted RNA-binding Zn-ribbon protein involved in translation (DUF1610 family)
VVTDVKTNPAWRVCPDCGIALGRKTISLSKSFACPRCGKRLRVKQAWFRVRALIVFLLSPLLTYVFGLRGLGFVIVSVLALWPLGLATKLIVNAVLAPQVVDRPHNDPEINRCPKCGIELENKFGYREPFACPACGERLEIVMGKGLLFMTVSMVLWLFVATPLAALLGYEFGIRGINVGLLPLAVFLGGAAILSLLFRLAEGSVHFGRVKVAPPDAPTKTVAQILQEGQGDMWRILREHNQRTELKLDDKKRL